MLTSLRLDAAERVILLQTEVFEYFTETAFHLSH